MRSNAVTWRSIGEVAEVVTGSTPKKSNSNFYGGAIPWIKPGDVQNRITPIRATDDTLSELGAKQARILPPKAILVTCIGEIGRVGITDIPSATNQQINAVIFNDEVLPEYGLYAILYSKSRLEKASTATTVPILNKSNLQKVPIPILPKEKQLVLAEKMRHLEIAKEQRATSIKLLDEYLRSLFIEMFGDPSVNPKKWAMEELGKHIDILTDYHANGSYETLRKHVELLNEKNYALMVRTTDLEHNEFEKNVNYITKEAYDFLAKSKVFGGEIIINKIGSAGNVYLMPHLSRPVSLGMNAFLLRFRNTLNSTFVYHLLTSDYGKSIIKVHVKGAVTKTITKDAVRSLLVPVPPIELQNDFVEKVRQIQSLGDQLKTSQANINSLFNALMNEAFQ